MTHFSNCASLSFADVENCVGGNAEQSDSYCRPSNRLSPSWINIVAVVVGQRFVVNKCKNHDGLLIKKLSQAEQKR